MLFIIFFNILVNIQIFKKHNQKSPLKNVSFYFLGEFNFPNIDWDIPSSTFNECNKSFIKICSENFLTQIINLPTHKDIGIFDVVL